MQPRELLSCWVPIANHVPCWQLLPHRAAIRPHPLPIGHIQRQHRLHLLLSVLKPVHVDVAAGRVRVQSDHRPLWLLRCSHLCCWLRAYPEPCGRDVQRGHIYPCQPVRPLRLHGMLPMPCGMDWFACGRGNDDKSGDLARQLSVRIGRWGLVHRHHCRL